MAAVGTIISSGKALGGGQARSSGGSGGTGSGGAAVVSGDYVASLNTADGNPGVQVKLSGENASDSWRFIGADRQHEIIQATATIQGATAGSSLEVTIPSSFAQGAAGNNWQLVISAGAAPQPAQAAYVDLFGSATQYLRVQLNAAGTDGNDWKVIIARTTGATSAAASIDTTNERLTITITSTATLAAVKTAIDNSVSGVTTTLVGTNPGTAVIGARTTAQIAGSQTHNATANTIDFHSGAAATSRDGLSFNVDTTNRRATVGGVYSDTRLRGIVSVQSQINRVWAGAAIVGPSDTDSVVGSTSSTTAFSGGLDIVPLSARVDETAQTVTLHYESNVDTLDDIVPILEAASNIEARLYGGVVGTSLPQTPPFSVNFAPEAILSEADIRAIIANTAAVVEIAQVDSTTLRVTLRDGSTLDLTVGGGSSVLALPNVPATDPTVNGVLLFLTADVTTFTAGKTVRNEADDADLTSGTEGDLYEWNLTGTKWVRLFSGSAGGGLTQSEVEALIEPVQDEVNAIISLHKKYTADDTTLTGNGTVDITFDITDILDYITFSDNTRARFVVDFQDSRHPASGRVLDASLIDSGLTIGTLDTDTLASPGNSSGRFHRITTDVSNLNNNTLTLRIVIASAGPSVVHTFDNITLDAYPSYTSGQSFDFVTSIPEDSTGEDSDIAINTDTGEFYMKESGSWFNFADLVTQTELQNFIIVSNNFPSTDPPNGTLLFFSSAQSSFTTGKTVRNRVNNADVTSANTGDLFKFSSANTRWLRQYQIPTTQVSGNNPVFAARAEQVFFNANTNVGSTDQDADLRTADPIVTRYPTGGSTPILVSAVNGDANAIQILKSGVYYVHLDGTGTAEGSGSTRRVLPRIRFYLGETLFGEVDDHYHRTTNTNNALVMSGDGVLYVPNDNLVLTMQIGNEITANGNAFNASANWSLTFSPLGVEGDQGERGRFDISIYQNVASNAVPTTAPTGGTFTYETGVLSDVPSGWSQTPTTPTGTQRTVKAITTIDYSNRSGATESVTWSAPIPETGAPGADGSGADLLFGAYANGAIPVNRIVTFGGNIYWTTANIPSDNTDDPTENSNFRQLDIGSDNDLVGAILVGTTTLRLSTRGGSSIDISLPSGGTSTLSEPNIPATDPTVDGTLLFLNADVMTFTVGKTVRNEADDGDVTTGLEGDCYKWILGETKWVRQFQGAGIYETMPLDEADTEGNLVATSATLPTVAQTTAFTGAWRITTELSGVTSRGGILQGLPRLRPSTSVFGLSVSAYEGDTKVGETFFTLGAYGPDPDSTVGLSYSAKPLAFDNGEVIMVDYYHDDDNGDSIRLSGVGDVLPASATVQVRLAISGNASPSGQSGQSGGQTGVSFITQNLIQITQWIRSSSAPADPGTVSYDSTAGTFSGLGQNGWSRERPASGTDPYWTATVSLVRGSDGVWSDGTDWVITAANSSLIQFRNYATNAWEAAPSDTMSMMRIWTDGVWREIPLSTNNLLFETDPNDNELLTLASPVSVSDIEYLRLDVEQGQTRITTRISMDMLAGVNRDQLQEHQGAMEATRSELNRTMVFLLDRWGFGGCMVVGSQNISQRDYSQAGGAYFNFFVNSNDQITHCRIISTFGIINYLSSSTDTILRIVAETQ